MDGKNSMWRGKGCGIVVGHEDNLVGVQIIDQGGALSRWMEDIVF